ncbi:hypothetical protein SLH49_20755 [Cognatiyoonia sp. IB215446]|uniref:COG4280 domain-containing protein n=1 Tax=Cognatiyoonia sp. IB215446 TaxID=3097355 RepID=UPI002A14717D|nr:hypothetical protein [Cognatiyoonia sp. IB215446]MDX8350427.1 hypothetical protein [Cognatiyoonia sp. IB215446]
MSAPAAVFLAAFLACVVEALETVTLLMAVASARGWRPVLIGAVAGFLVLTILVVVFVPLIDLLPRDTLHLVVGMLLLLFGAGWLRKSILRAAGQAARHDFDAEFDAARADFARPGIADWVAGIAAFKAVLLEGLEVIFVVLALGGTNSLTPALTGAISACLIVFAAAFFLRKPLSRVPDNTLKFWTGVMLTAFGTYWVAEGLGGDWPGGDLALLGLVAFFAGLSGLLIRRLSFAVAAP